MVGQSNKRYTKMIPKFYDLILPVLEVSNTGKEVSDEFVEEFLAKRFGLTEQERKTLKSSGSEPLFLNKIRWAKTHLCYAGLIEKTKRARFCITQRGREVLEIKPEKITEKFLARFDEYREKRGVGIRFERVWAMPNKWTFDIQPIAELIDSEIEGFSVDPFCGHSLIADLRNDIDPEAMAQHHTDAFEFMKSLGAESVDTMIYDPPYSPRQVSECYKKLGRKVDQTTTQSSFWGRFRDEISRVVKIGGKVIKCGWNTNGFDGFTLERVLLVPHGGNHNDTIVTVWRKIARIESGMMKYSTKTILEYV